MLNSAVKTQCQIGTEPHSSPPGVLAPQTNTGKCPFYWNCKNSSVCGCAQVRMFVWFCVAPVHQFNPCQCVVLFLVQSCERVQGFLFKCDWVYLDPFCVLGLDMANWEVTRPEHRNQISLWVLSSHSEKSLCFPPSHLPCRSLRLLWKLTFLFPEVCCTAVPGLGSGAKVLYFWCGCDGSPELEVGEAIS